jgi:hypothetical protein
MTASVFKCRLTLSVKFSLSLNLFQPKAEINCVV